MMTESKLKRKTTLAFALCSILLLGNCSKENVPATKPPVTSQKVGSAQVWLTTGDQAQLLSNNTVDLTTGATFTVPVIALDSTTKYQQIEGFGAAMTGSSAYVLKQLSSSQQSALLTDLFDTTNGIGISYLRTSIGASDFSVNDYSYDDVASGSTDYNLTNFSLDVDADVIAMLQAAIKVNPSIKILGSPWSAPAWMKSNGKMEGGSLNTTAYDAYANYFLKYVNGMKAKGITIDALTLQNEPLYSTASYPCMSMTQDEQRNLIVNNVGPLFQSNGITTKILVYDHNWDNVSYPISIITDATAKQYVAGSAFHGYGGTVSAMTNVHTAATDMGLYFTEQSGGGWQSSAFSDNLKYFVNDIFIGTTTNWSKNVLLWNLALDQNSGPQNNGCSNCRGVVTINAGSTITHNVEYYSIAHFSKVVKPGAYRIASSAPSTFTNVGYVAFQNTDGSKAVVIMNYNSTTQSFAVTLGTRQLTYSLPANSVVTLKWN